MAASVSVNVTAPLLFADRFIAASAGAPDRRLLHVSSGAARSAYPGWSIYCATKAALDHHARAIALENHPGLRVASLAPGVIDTGMQAEIRATPGDRFHLRQRFVALKEQGLLTCPAVAARQLVDHLLGDPFGDPVIADLREA
jgi:benzil reductase ((S)-benzoin forming)